MRFLYVLPLVLVIVFGIRQFTEINPTRLLSLEKHSSLGLYMTAVEAEKYMVENGQKSLFVDVRTRGEISYLGMPTIVDANIPFMKMAEMFIWNQDVDNFKLEINLRFLEGVSKRLRGKKLTKSDVVILISRAGKRSAQAVSLLAKSGFSNVYSVVDGYEGDKIKNGYLKEFRRMNGWKNSNLAWSYTLDETKMYFPVE